MALVLLLVTALAIVIFKGPRTSAGKNAASPTASASPSPSPSGPPLASLNTPELPSIAPTQAGPSGGPAVVPPAPVGEPSVVVSGQITIPAGMSLHADSKYKTVGDAGLGDFGDFMVTNDFEDQPGVFTGAQGDLAPSKSASWNECRQAKGFGAVLTAADLKPGTTLCGITHEGHVVGITVLGAKADSRRHLTSVSIRYTTWSSE
ncbi:hypothetical protein [Micromonospora sp. NPDC051141]|uniref:hypothetical protein n=1 Tax=Micromonospora sp. NPDC051141 TaxID=3364284 RepID=UPI0037BCAF13